MGAYRVLLTRARQGLIVFVPHGDAKDRTRPPAFYDETYAFLISCGIPELKLDKLSRQRSAVPCLLCACWELNSAAICTRNFM
jgi:hypothetical protein